MRLFYAHSLNEISTEIVLDETDSRHLSKVLRSKPGDVVDLTNGQGLKARGTVTEIGKKAVKLFVDDQQRTERSWTPDITLAVAPTKSVDRLEWLIEKATEIGVNRIVPILSAQSERKHLKLDRLERIAISAMKQSQQYWLPKIDALTDFSAFINQVDQANKWIAHCDGQFERTNPSVSNDQEVVILIGPEGDFAPVEIRLAAEKGFKAITLGPNRLRTETAAISALLKCHFLYQ